jgi:hypothetical protein
MNIIPLNTGHTVRSTPPVMRQSQRRSYWPAVLAEARQVRGAWVRTVKTFGRSTAQQLASDLRNAHHREPKKFRVRGVLPGEVWDAQWGREGVDSPDTEYVVWIRLVSTSESRTRDVSKLIDDDIW